ncbi:MAG: hypothetical protein EHM20_11295, partial [Alphaproteobacteria bacterium]
MNKDEEIKFCFEKACLIEETYKMFVDLTKSHLFSWDFTPLGWAPETKEWPLWKKILFTLFMPYMMNDELIKPIALKILISSFGIMYILGLFLWGWAMTDVTMKPTSYSIPEPSTSEYTFTLLATPEPSTNDYTVTETKTQKDSDDNEIIFFVIIVTILAAIPYFQTGWYILQKKTSREHRLFIILCNSILGYLIYNQLSTSINSLTISIGLVKTIYFALISWIPVILVFTMILLVIAKLIFYVIYTTWQYLSSAHSTENSEIINFMLFGIIKENKVHDGFIHLLTLSQITYLKELTQRNLDSAEKRTTPSIIVFMAIPIMIALLPVTAWFKKSCEYSLTYLQSILQSDFSFLVFLIKVLPIVTVATIILIVVFSVLLQYARLITNIFVQAIL